MQILGPALLLIASIAPASAYAQASKAVGTWKGQSLCVQSSTACRNESVVYYIEALKGDLDHMQIRADKVVDGKAITMGTGPWNFDSTHNTFEWKSSQQVWRLNLTDTHIEGTLTLADGTLVRKMTLDKQ